MTEHHFTLEHGDFSAKLVLGGKHSLYDFAAILIKTVRFDFDHPFEFCDNLKRPYRSKERYSLFADMAMAMVSWVWRKHWFRRCFGRDEK